MYPSTSARTTLWPQTAYGKLVKPDGDIQGPDYNRTGSSADFPRGLESFCSPSELVTSREIWSLYRWLETQGPLLLRPVRDDHSGAWSFVASRIRPRIERPNSPERRYYVETRHAVAPIAQVRFADLFALPECLRAEPLLEKNANLPLLQVEPRVPYRLEGNWFGAVRPLLEVVACGARATSTDERLSPDAFFLRGLLCLCCLPGTLRWRVPLAGGLLEIPSGERDKLRLGLAHGGSGGAGARPDLSSGRAYADWVEKIAAGVGSVDELLETVDGHLGDLRAVDAVPLDSPWPDAMHALEEVRVVERLSVWMGAPYGRPPALTELTQFRAVAVRTILTATLKRYASFAPPEVELLSAIVDPQWQDAWEQAAVGAPDAERFRAAAGLLGVDGAVAPDKLGYYYDAFDLPPALLEVAVERLTAALASCPDANLPEWDDLLNLAGNSSRANWLALWWAREQGLLAWRAARLFMMKREASWIRGWDGLSAKLASPDPLRRSARFVGQGSPTAAVRSLLCGTSATVADFQALWDAVPTAASAYRNDAVWLSQHLRGQWRAETIQLAAAIEDKQQKRTWLTEELSTLALRTRSAEDRQRLALALADAASVYHPTVRMLWGLAVLWDALPPERREPLLPLVTGFLGQPFARFVLDYARPIYAAGSEWACDAASAAFVLFPQRLMKAAEYAFTQAAGREAELLSHAVLPALAQANLDELGQTYPLLRFVAQAQRRQAFDYPAIDERTFLLARGLANHFNRCRLRPPAVTDSSQLYAVLAFAAWFDRPPDVGAQVWETWLAQAADDVDLASWLARQLGDAGWSDLPRWRLLGNPGELAALTDAEEAVLLQVSPFVLLRQSLRGLPLSPRLAARLDAEVLRQCAVTPEQARNLATSDFLVLTYEVFKFAWSALKNDSLARSWVRDKCHSTVLARLFASRTPDNPWATVAFDAVDKLGPWREALVIWLAKSEEAPPTSLLWKRVVPKRSSLDR